MIVVSAACGSSGNRAANVAAVNNQPNAARNMNKPTAEKSEVKTDLESLEKQINLPVRPSEVRWAADVLDNSKGDFPAPSDRRLTVLLKYDETSAAELTGKLSGAPMDASLGKAEIKSWFPDEVKNAARNVDGRTYLEGAKYPPDAFLRSPYLNGSVVRVENTGYFVLDLHSF